MEKSTVDKLQDAAKLKAELDAKRAEQVKMLKDCANRLFSTDDGKFFARAIYQTSGIFEAPDFAHNPQALEGQQLAFQKGMETLYILFFRKILDKDVLSAIERGE